VDEGDDLNALFALQIAEIAGQGLASTGVVAGIVLEIAQEVEMADPLGIAVTVQLIAAPGFDQSALQP
jgi:hypothetical protein